MDAFITTMSNKINNPTGGVKLTHHHTFVRGYLCCTTQCRYRPGGWHAYHVYRLHCDNACIAACTLVWVAICVRRRLPGGAAVEVDSCFRCCCCCYSWRQRRRRTTMGLTMTIERYILRRLPINPFIYPCIILPRTQSRKNKMGIFRDSETILLSFSYVQNI